MNRSARPPATNRLPLFVFEALGSLACGFYGNYIFFLFRDRDGFGDQGNLGIAALMGLVIALASWQGGRFAQRRGLVRTMHLGLWGMIIALTIGACFAPLAVQLAVLVWANSLASMLAVGAALWAFTFRCVGGRGRWVMAALLVGGLAAAWVGVRATLAM